MSTSRLRNGKQKGAQQAANQKNKWSSLLLNYGGEKFSETKVRNTKATFMEIKINIVYLGIN
uniref:Uncharacterized protein n=1 Tax=Romanomermis culicivorax TaxID=13658 RepID=A0A915JG70_ROMCU